MTVYEIGRVYILESLKTDKKYIGSTGMRYLSQRLASHRQKYKLYLECKWFKYYTSFDILKEGDVMIRELACYMNIEKKKLNEIEGEWIKKTPMCVNKLLSKERVSDEEIKERTKVNILCECGESIRKYGMKRHIKSLKHIHGVDFNKKKEDEAEKEEEREKAKKEDKEKRKTYVKENKDRINENAKKKKMCDCGSEFRAKDRLRHEKSIKHINWLRCKDVE